MKILISNTSDAPLYQQIKEQIIDAILKVNWLRETLYRLLGHLPMI